MRLLLRSHTGRRSLGLRPTFGFAAPKVAPATFLVVRPTTRTTAQVGITTGAVILLQGLMRALTDPRELDLAAAVLGRAFANDPGFAYVLGEGDRVPALTWLSRRFIDYTINAHGEVTAIGDPIKGVLLSMDVPARYTLSTLGMIRAGMYGSPFRLGPGAVVRLARFGARLDDVHARAMDRRHRYIFYLGVDPKHQGHGVGKSLLRPKLEGLDTPAYLETLLLLNVKLYRSLGFAVFEESPGPPGPHAWCMVLSSLALEPVARLA